jgi:hypothetical protein
VTRYSIKPNLLGRAEKRLARQFRATRVERQLRAAGAEIKKYLQARSSGVYYKGDYSKGWYALVYRSTMVVGNKAKHWIFVEKGRGANKRMPPVSIIREWVIAKGMEASAAFPIARAIGKRGITARPLFLLPTTQRALDAIVDKHISRWFDRVLRSTR